MFPVIFTTDVDMISEYPDIYHNADESTEESMVNFVNEMLKQVAEEEIVIEPFVRDMCNYYKIEDDEVKLWQEYYQYLKEEEKDLNKVQNKLNEEMKLHLEEKIHEQDMAVLEITNRTHMGAPNPIWNAINKG